MCVRACVRACMCVYTLLKVVRHYDLSVLSLSEMGFQNKVWMGVGGRGELYPVSFFDFWNFINFAKPLIIKIINKYTLILLFSAITNKDSAEQNWS